jgi:hypothetical protein
MAKKKKQTVETTETVEFTTEDLMRELEYLLAEGFIVKMDDETYRLKTKEELKNELDNL